MSGHTPDEIMTLLGFDEDTVKVPFSDETKRNLKEILSDEFMREYTNCNSLDGFMFSSAVFVNWDSSLLIYSKSRFDLFVSEATSFSSWEEMLQKASEIYSKRTTKRP
jgi:hypothetical protein